MISLNETIDDDLAHDRPIETADLDRLDRGPFVDSLVKALIRPELIEDGRIVGRKATGFVVGLTGAWGLGKSSILHLVAQELDEIPFVAVARFNPWLFKGRDELVIAFFNALRQALGKSSGEYGRDLVAAVDTYWEAIDTAGTAAAGVADLHGTAGFSTWGWKLLKKVRPKKKPTPRTPEEERRALEKKLKSRRLAVVVLIDELDRVEDDEVRAVAQLVKAVGDIAGVSYLVAYDPERVADALGRGTAPKERRESGERYLEKIIQHAIPIRPLFREDVDALMGAALSSNSLTALNIADEARKSLLDKVLNAISTPREVKRLVGTFAVLEAAVSGEIDPIDILAYSWIAIKSPNLRAAIALNPDKLVIDPALHEMIGRISAPRENREAVITPAEALGDVAESQNEILKLLFSRFERHADKPDGNRISYRRNLVRLLYLGNPPGMLPRNRVEALWVSNDAAYLAPELRELVGQGRIRDLIARIADLHLHMPAGGNSVFWTSLSQSLLRDSDWATGPTELRSAIDDAEQLMFIIADSNNASAKNAIKALIDHGDLVIVPSILRKHLFAHGLTPLDTARGGDSFLSKDETAAILEREAPRYRTAIADGSALRRVADVELWFVLSNCKIWDEELRAHLTDQLSSPEAIATAATLLTPEGWSIDYDTVNGFFDAELVRGRLETFIAESKMPTGDWVSSAVRRFRRRLTSSNATGN